MDKPIILCGLGRVGWRVLEYLRTAGLSVIVIDIRCETSDPRLAGIRLVKGDCRQHQTLLDAGVQDCGGVLILTSDDLINISTALLVRHLSPDVRVVIRMFNQNLLLRLGKSVHNVLSLSTSTLTAPLLAVTALTGQALGTYRMDGLRSSPHQVAELIAGPASRLPGKTIAEVTRDLEVYTLAHLRRGDAERLLCDVDATAAIQAGDRLVLGGDPEHIASLMERSGEDVGPHVLWAGWLRRTGRVVWRTMTEIDRPVLICLGVLLSVVMTSTFIFHAGVHKYTIGDAFYRTISVMATGAEMGEKDFGPGWPRIFASVLRILGATLTAAFTAIFANYLLRARLSGALEVRRIPDSGHVIVCGLGNLGFRTVQELVRADERVVSIELLPNNRFTTTARRLGVAVIHGDATVREVLRQAHAATARAVIAATSNELVNLEIALLVRELNPKQRVVVCLVDPNLAQTLREAANIQLAVSVPALAAPAFVAALFGDRVQGLFLIEGKLVSVVNLAVQPQDTTLIGQSVQAVASDYRLLPMALQNGDGKITWKPRDEVLQPGDQLTAFVTLPQLERLMRRQPGSQKP
jgi:Trk K+ transport system NAD-binding subunit